MGVRCVLSGHLYEATEFEEHRRERPEGMVLICREYRVCSRCGNREEMYRNEQLLTPRERMDGKDGPENKRSGSEKGGNGSNTDKSSSENEKSGRDMTENDSEHANARETESLLEDSPALETDPDNDTSDSPLSANEIGASSADGGDGSDGEDSSDSGDGSDGSEAAAEESVSFDSLPGASTTGTDKDDTSDRADRIDRLRNPGNEPIRMADPQADSESHVNGSSETGETHNGADETYSGTEKDTAGDTTDDSADEEPADDAVIISETDASTSSPGEHGDRYGAGIYCQACGGTWNRETTSLREGDLCPECRQGYVESR